MGVASGIELGCSYELGSGQTRIGVLTRPRWGLGMVMTGLGERGARGPGERGPEALGEYGLEAWGTCYLLC